MRRKRWSRSVQGSSGGELHGQDPGGDGLRDAVITAELTHEDGVKEAAVWAERRSSGARSCGSYSVEESSEAHWQGRAG